MKVTTHQQQTVASISHNLLWQFVCYEYPPVTGHFNDIWSFQLHGCYYHMHGEHNGHHQIFT